MEIVMLNLSKDLPLIDFSKKGLRILCHPRYQQEKKFLEHYFSCLEEGFDDHFVLFSSGTTGHLKGVILSRPSLLKNAKAVNDFYQLSTDDKWGLSLPLYHVGGLSVIARSYLTKSDVIDLRGWNPREWKKKVQQSRITITTIVPTQLYDLVREKIPPPTCLRYLIVGGDFLSEELKMRAYQMGWPIRHTFGMSEVCSQIASEKEFHMKHHLEVLPIHDVKEKEGRLFIKSSSFFSYQFFLKKNERSYEITLRSYQDFIDEQGFLPTSDLVKIHHNMISPLGRVENEFKIAGHLINLNQLKQTLSTYLLKNNLFNQAELVVRPAERKGKELILLLLKNSALKDHLHEIYDLFSPIKIDRVIEVHSFKRTDLGKLKQNQ